MDRKKKNKKPKTREKLRRTYIEYAVLNRDSGTHSCSSRWQTVGILRYHYMLTNGPPSFKQSSHVLPHWRSIHTFLENTSSVANSLRICKHTLINYTLTYNVTVYIANICEHLSFTLCIESLLVKEMDDAEGGNDRALQLAIVSGVSTILSYCHVLTTT